MDALGQANVITKTQLTNGHRKLPKQRSWKKQSLILGVKEGAQWNLNGIQKDTSRPHVFTDK